MSKEDWRPSRSFSETQLDFLNSLTDLDMVSIYAEWVSKNKLADESTQNGFIFEVLSKRFLQDLEGSPKSLQLAKDVFTSLTSGQSQRTIWNEERCIPDDLVFNFTSHAIEIRKIVECKISTHAIVRSFHQKEATKHTVRSLINVLNGNYEEIRNEQGKKIVTEAREKLRHAYSLPLSLSQNYKYVYVIPQGQHYTSQHPKDSNLDVVKLPLSTSDIDLLRESLFSYLTKVDL